jgi:hypothetical protein
MKMIVSLMVALSIAAATAPASALDAKQFFEQQERNSAN